MNCEITKNSDIFYDCADRFRNEIFFNHRNRRALSDVIATLLLLSVTMVLAVMLSAFLQGSGFASIGSSFNTAALESQIPPSLKLTGYDTRDENDLYGITFLDNTKDGKLCTINCPTTTEFIVLKIKNDGSGSYTVNDLLINGIDHLWDGGANGVSLSGNLPTSGKFSIIKADDTKRSNILASGDEVRIVIRLSKDLMMSNSDVGYYLPLKIVFLGSINAPTFVIFSGDVT